MPTSRRDFLQSGLKAAPAILLPIFLKPDILTALSLLSTVSPVNGRTLVIIQLAGGNDGLNTVIPFTDSRYYAARPNLAVQPGKVIQLNADTGLHPNLEKFKELWDGKALAIIEGVEYPNPSYSHFASMQIWQTADPTLQQTEGWLGRYFDSLNPPAMNSVPTLAVGSKTPPEMFSNKLAIPVLQTIAAYKFQSDSVYPASAQNRVGSLLNIYQASKGNSTDYSFLNETAQALETSSQILTAADQSYKSTVTYPNTPFANALRTVAETIVANVGLNVAQVALGGFDTHADQETTQSQLFTILSEAVFAFYQDLIAHGKENDVIIMTWSEFGRRVQSNGSGGTDHGSAAPLFVIGKPIISGLYGKRCDLGNLDNGNLRFTTDFRSIYATVLEKWLGISADTILGPNQFERFTFLP